MQLNSEITATTLPGSPSETPADAQVRRAHSRDHWARRLPRTSHAEIGVSDWHWSKASAQVSADLGVGLALSALPVLGADAGDLRSRCPAEPLSHRRRGCC